MQHLLFKLQIFCFSKGAEKPYCMWDRIGNLIQDIREKLNKIKL